MPQSHVAKHNSDRGEEEIFACFEGWAHIGYKKAGASFKRQMVYVVVKQKAVYGVRRWRVWHSRKEQVVMAVVVESRRNLQCSSLV
jgi:hypothetical protein